MLLTIDIGGTNTRLAIFEFGSSILSPTNIRIYNSNLYQGIEVIVKDYEKSLQIKPEYAVIGVPGPVLGGSAKATNLSWKLYEKELKAKLNFSDVKIINDVEALGYSIEVLENSDFEYINTGRHQAGTPIAIIAPGTGLGESFLIKDDNYYRVYSSEGGHSDFAPTNKMEIKLLNYLLNSFDHVSYERVCSGQGLCNIYDFLKDDNICIEPIWLKNILINSQDHPKVISQNALSEDKAESITIKAVDIFVSIMGAEAANMALRFNAKNGVYIGGGIAPKIIPFIKKELFMRSFKKKGRLSDFVADIPVKVICKPEVNLYGLANFAKKKIKIQ